MQNTIIRLPDVIKRTGLSKSTIYLYIEHGKFPAQIRLGSRSVGWIEAQIDDWINQQIEASRNTHK